MSRHRSSRPQGLRPVQQNWNYYDIVGLEFGLVCQWALYHDLIKTKVCFGSIHGLLIDLQLQGIVFVEPGTQIFKILYLVKVVMTHYEQHLWTTSSPPSYHHRSLVQF